MISLPPVDFEVRGELYCSPLGIQLLKKRPDFINSVWRNPLTRRTLNLEAYRIVTELEDIYGRKYIEDVKRNQGKYLLFRHINTAAMLDVRGFEQVKVVGHYFADEHSLLTDFIENVRTGRVDSDFEGLNSCALAEIQILLLARNRIRFGNDKNGRAILVDPPRGLFL